MLQNHPQLGDFLLKFLRNQQYKQEQTELARKVNSIEEISFDESLILRHVFPQQIQTVFHTKMKT